MNDQELTELFWLRSETALQTAEMCFGGLCESIAFNILHSCQDARECVNDVLLAAWNAIPPERPKCFAAYLGRLTRNIALNRYDYNTAAKRNASFDVLLSELEDCLPGGSDPFEEGRIVETIGVFLRCETRVNRQLFVRRYWYSDSIAELSQSFGISESKVKYRLQCTRTKLRQHLVMEGVDL